MRSSFLSSLAGVVALLCSAFALAAPMPASFEDSEAAIGRFASFLQEGHEPLALSSALVASQSGKFIPAKNPVLNFGIGAKPTWVHFAVDNDSGSALLRRLSVETSWLDHMEVYFRHGGTTVAEYRVGDRLPFTERPRPGRYFTFDHVFDTGVTDVYLRVSTPDPMVIPIYLLDPEASHLRETWQEQSYGLIYGALFALMAYNAILFVSLRSSSYLLYSIYLAMFLAMNIAYTGHGLAWIWHDAVSWQMWSNPVLIYLYGVAGLMFADRFLDLKVHFPRMRIAVLTYCATFGLMLAVAMLLGSQKYALLASFVFIFLFTNLMLALGIMAVRAGQRAARYFLVAAVAAMIGASLTTLSTWGFIPYNDWAFRAVEVGMLVDATLLALALGYQFRVGQEERVRAEQLAQTDPLTGLNNRRAFYDKTAAVWSTAIRHDHSASVVLMDIDRFKEINDAHGHAYGDRVLRAAADALKSAIRAGDILARWGGEEFIIFLPETPVGEAVRLAERLRRILAGLHMPDGKAGMEVTASFGVAQREPDHATLDSLVASADNCLYQSKQQGRNRVTGCAAGECTLPATLLAAAGTAN